MEKANVMESGILWREEVQWVHDNEYPDVELSHMYADNGAMQLVRRPNQFDVIVTDNLFGDIITDLAGAVTGGGLTVIANAPNPAGFAILKHYFPDGTISPLKLFLAASLPTVVAIFAFLGLRGIPA